MAVHAAGCLGLAGTRGRGVSGWYGWPPCWRTAASLCCRPDAADAAAWSLCKMWHLLAWLQRGQQAQRVIADLQEQVASQATKVQL